MTCLPSLKLLMIAGNKLNSSAKKVIEQLKKKRD